MSRDIYDVIIIGAGMIGASCAHALARAGRRVLVIDAGPVAAQTSSKGMGHIAAMAEADAQLALTTYSRRLWQRLSPELPSETDFMPCGTLWIAKSPESIALLQDRHNRFTKADIHAEMLSARMLASVEPNVCTNLAGALHVTGDCTIFPPRAAGWLIDQAQGHGASVMLGFRVATIEPDGVVLDNGTKLHARAIVNAGGVQSPELTTGVPVRRRKGHIVVAQSARPFCFHQLVEIAVGASSALNSTPQAVPAAPTGRALLTSAMQLFARTVQRANPAALPTLTLAIFVKRAGTARLTVHQPARLVQEVKAPLLPG